MTPFSVYMSVGEWQVGGESGKWQCREGGGVWVSRVAQTVSAIYNKCQMPEKQAREQGTSSAAIGSTAPCET